MRPPHASALVTLFAGLAAAGCGTLGGRQAAPASASSGSLDFAEYEAAPAPSDDAESGPNDNARHAVAQSFGGSSRSVAAQGRVVVQKGPPPPGSSERLTISGSVTVRTVDVNALVEEVRAHAAEVGGSVVGETVNGNAEEGHASMRLRLPPAQAVPFADWLAARATLELRNIETTDVSRRYVDQALAIKNLNITMSRLQELAKRPDAPLKDVLEAERELTRVRGELERMEGEHRLLEDQIARATLVVNIRPKRGANPPSLHVEPELKFELVPRVVLFHFLDGGARHQDRWGGGASVMFSRAFSLELVVLPQEGVDKRSFLLDAAAAAYSDFLGGGRRRFLNPYLGLRTGWASLNGNNAWVFGGEVGLELLHVKSFIVEVAGRGLWFIYGKDIPYDVGLEGTLGVGVPF